MNKMVKVVFLAVYYIIPSILFAQNDSIWLKCPLEEAIVVPPPKNVMKFDQPDLCIVLVSIPDTTVKAVVGGRVSNVVQNDDGKWDIVFYYRDYYFWYSGLSKPLVRRGDNLKAGQAMGYISVGTKLEFLMYDFETPIDPIRFLECKKVLKTE